MTENKIYNLGLEKDEASDLQDILIEKMKKDFKGVTTQSKSRLNHSIEVNTFRDLVIIYAKVAHLQAEIEEDIHREVEASLPDLQ